MTLGVVGYGVVGRGLCDRLERFKEPFLVYLRDPAKFNQARYHFATLCTESDEVVRRCEVIFEATCGSEGVPLVVAEAVIRAGKTLITSNKKLICDHYHHLCDLQNQHPQSRIYIEACVCGGVPLYKTLLMTFHANQDSLLKLEGIINGSTNWYLCRAAQLSEDYENRRESGMDWGDSGGGSDGGSGGGSGGGRPTTPTRKPTTTPPTTRNEMMDLILEEMNELGYLEADPSVDLDGFDAAYKLRILAAMLLGWDCAGSMKVHGVRDLIYEDFEFMRKNNFSAIRLVASLYRDENHEWCAEVVPRFVRDPLFEANVGGQNTILIETKDLGEVVFKGPGAGEHPTVNAMISDYAYAKLDLQSPDPTSPHPGRLRPITLNVVSTSTSLGQVVAPAGEGGVVVGSPTSGVGKGSGGGGGGGRRVGCDDKATEEKFDESKSELVANKREVVETPPDGVVAASPPDEVVAAASPAASLPREVVVLSKIKVKRPSSGRKKVFRIHLPEGLVKYEVLDYGNSSEAAEGVFVGNFLS